MGGTSAETHRGGCLFCRWFSCRERGRPCCTHRDTYPPRALVYDAREPGQACGPRATLWAFGPPAD